MNRSFWIPLGILVVLISGLPAQAEVIRSTPPIFFMVQMHSLTGPEAAHRQALEYARSMGAEMVRDELFWHLVEKEKGVYRIPGDCLNNLRLTVEYGLQPFLILDYGNLLYDDGMAPVSGEALQAFADYAAHLAGELIGLATCFEVWNEPNTDGFWRPRQDAKAYAALLQAVYPAVKRANPKATVVGCTLAGLDEAFLDGVAKAGGLQSMDAISVHTYCTPASPEGRGTFDEVRRFSRRVDALAGRHLPVWITEMGWPTQEGGGVSELRQAEMLARSYLLASAYPEIQALGWYWLGPDGPDRFWAEDRFSLSHEDGSPKPGRVAYRAVADLLKEASFERWLIDAPEVKAALYRRCEGWTVALWSADDQLHQVFTRGIQSVIRLSGRRTPIDPGFRTIELEIDGEPLLLEYREEPAPMTYSEKAIPRPRFKPVAPGMELLFRAQYRAGGLAQYWMEPRWNEVLLSEGPASGPIRFQLGPNTPMGPGRADLFSNIIHQNKLRIQAYSFEVGPPLRMLLSPQRGPGGQRNIDLKVISVAGAIDGPVQSHIEIDGATGDSWPESIKVKTETENYLIPLKGTFSNGDLVQVRVALTPPGGTPIEAEDLISFTEIPRATQPIQIDADLSEWDFNPERCIFLGLREQFALAGMTWDGTRDASAWVAMQWDPEWLYFAAKVTDDIFSDTASGVDVYKNDGFELYFDTDPEGDAEETTYSGDDHQWGVCASAGGAVVYRWSQRSGPSEKGVAKIRRTLDGYRIEAKIPADELTPPEGKGRFSGRFEPGMHLGFTVALDDDDSPEGSHPFHQDLQLQWSRKRNAFMNPNAFADLFLGK